MATAIRTYFATLRQLTNQLAMQMGCDVTQLPIDQRAGDAACLAAVATLCRALVDKGVLTNADLQAAVATAEAEVWPQEPNNP